MKTAILLRGFHYLSHDRFGYHLNGLDFVQSFQENILVPLSSHHEVRLYLVSYPSPIWEALQRAYSPHQVLLLDPKVSHQIDTFDAGLAMIEKDFPDVDRIISSRFDLMYQSSINDWNIWQKAPGIYLPWREYERFWNEHERVGDFIHVIDRAYLDCFRQALAEQRDRSLLHYLYTSLRQKTSAIHFMVPTFHDSNTYYSNAECENPLYRIGNRPRLWIPQHLIAPNYQLLQCCEYLSKILTILLAFAHNQRRWIREKNHKAFADEWVFFAAGVRNFFKDFIMDLREKFSRRIPRKSAQKM